MTWIPWVISLAAAGVATWAALRATRGAAAGELLAEIAARQQQSAEQMQAALRDTTATLARHTAQSEGNVRAELLSKLEAGLGATRDALVQRLGTALIEHRTEQVAGLKQSTETLERKFGELVGAMQQQLERVRATVDEKLQGTLEARLGESFKLVSERLEQVHQGLGEMQGLASGVGDLKRALTNVKARGTWGEVQLAALLEQVLTPEQYATNVATHPGSNERVEFAVRLPGRSDDARDVVWLPIDAKYPQEDYLRLVEAQERGDAEAARAALAQLRARVVDGAREIREKYVHPPATTDFAILFLPTEGLYAEVLRSAGLVEALQRDQRVMVAGPTTLAALLNSLQLGFRTLAIQKRSSEVWTLLAAVKNEFGRFAEALAAVQKKLQEASAKMDAAATRTRAIERTLRTVEASPAAESRLALLTGEPAESLPQISDVG
ncbi:MAG: DNA recombination protein RmuC [Phycisphaerae bacterium]